MSGSASDSSLGYRQSQCHMPYDSSTAHAGISRGGTRRCLRQCAIPVIQHRARPRRCYSPQARCGTLSCQNIYMRGAGISKMSELQLVQIHTEILSSGWTFEGRSEACGQTNRLYLYKQQFHLYPEHLYIYIISDILDERLEHVMFCLNNKFMFFNIRLGIDPFKRWLLKLPIHPLCITE